MDANRTLIKNVGRNIVRKLVVKLNSNEIISIDDYDILYSYYGCWKCVTEKHNAVFQGVVDDKNVIIVCDIEGRLNEWIKLFKNALKGYETLFIIDDCSGEGEINKKRDALLELAFSSRHSLWVLTQKYNSVSKDVREQIKWLCLFFTKDWDSFKDCLRENDVIPDKTKGLD